MSDRPSTPPRSVRPGAPAPREPWLSRTARHRVVVASWVVAVASLFGMLAWAYRRFVLLHPDPTISWMVEGTRYELIDPKILGIALLIPYFVAVLPKSLADLPWPQRILSVLLRAAFVALLALGLSRLARTAETQKVCTVYVVDVSDSVPDEAIADARAIIAKAIVEKPEDAVVKVVSFARRPRLVELPEEQGRAVPIERHRAPEGEKQDLGAGSDLQAAMQLAEGLFPPGYVKRAVILSDGVQTDGDALAESNRARELGVRVFTMPYDRPAPPEVAIRELVIPDRVKVGETFEIKASIYATRTTKGRGRLYQGDTINGLDGVRQLELAPGLNTIIWKSVVRYAGQVTYGLELDQLESDRFPENNKVAATIDVPGRPSVLYVDGTPHHANPLANALTAQQFDVDVRPPVGFPGTLKEIERYDFVIVSDVAKESMSLASQDLIERYVRDLGGGFLFAGGENGYGLGGWYRTPMEKILPVRMENEKKKEMPSVAMSLVIDRSGSMTGLPMEMAKAAAKATVEIMSPDDLVEVIAFDNQPTRYVKFQPARNRSRIGADIARVQPGGGTEIFGALDAAYQDLSVVQARRKHVILLTDGKAPSSGIRDLVQSMVSESITVTTVGLGGDLDDQLLGMIAEVGGGRYHRVPDANNLPRVFTKETEMISRAAAVEEWFPVTQVGDAGFLKGVDIRTAPLLHGYVSTQMKPSPAQELLTSETSEPILARWRVGLGWTLAWTSDVKARWAVEWVRWPGWEKFWGQLVREHMRHKHQRELDMKADIVGGELRASVDAFTPDERFENGLSSKLTIRDPEPNGEEKVLDMRQTAPGRYEVRAPLDRYGSFLLRVDHRRTTPDGVEQTVAVSHGHVSNPYPREYASFEPNRELLGRVAETTGGSIDPKSVAEIFDPRGEKVTYHEELWTRFVWAALAVFVLDLLLRRVRLFDRKFVVARRA